MLRISAFRDQIGVVDDQIGTPTYAKDLADFLIRIIDQNSDTFGIFHYSNEGVASWYDFAHAVFEYSNIEIDLKPLSTDEYPLPAERPVYSVMSKNKIKDEFQINISHWRDSLKKCVLKLNK